ncbi:SPOR domain-containing protein [Novosphingobium sp. Gsoil 351]|uniref:SPOR domain-containing protein n=1 Tax=Novosphingobium sp. Gsoil 351 TaxID=2675225 RepID=UPI0012B486EE|nr:SPOR domain-containing protein [Novosphingobium sp. Gsoil 351]QGN55322.1 SPOR domain-containing protein [Novosphingobium sp. Gsoil 351]
MAGDDKTGRRSIFTSDDLPPEDAIPPAGNPVSPRWDGDREDEDYGTSGEGFAPAAPPRLSLGDGEERLPWLESADDIDPHEGFDSGRVIGFVLLGLVALGMIVAAVWIASHRGPAAADGSTIRAEAGPYKVPPENPGGKKFAGTGDTSYAVAQGETRSGTIAGEDGSPTPGVGATATASPSATGSATPAPKASTATGAAPVTSGGVGVQVGAYTSASDAEAGWTALSARHDALSGFKHRVVEGQAEFGRVFRLQAVAGDVASATELCTKLKASGQGCQVKK